eukprot:CFRG1818T1
MGRTLSTSSLSEQDVILLEALVETLDLSCMEDGDQLEVFVEDCGKRGSIVEFDVNSSAEVSSSEEDDQCLSDMFDLKSFFEIDTEQNYMEEHVRRSNKRVRFLDDVEVIMIENRNNGRKVSEIADMSRRVEQRREQNEKANEGLSVLRLHTNDGAVTVEVNEVAANYLKFVQEQRNIGKGFLVKDFFQEAQDFDEGHLPEQYYTRLRTPIVVAVDNNQHTSKRRMSLEQFGDEYEQFFHHEEFRETGRKRSSNNHQKYSKNNYRKDYCSKKQKSPSTDSSRHCRNDSREPQRQRFRSAERALDASYVHAQPWYPSMKADVSTTFGYETQIKHNRLEGKGYNNSNMRYCSNSKHNGTNGDKKYWRRNNSTGNYHSKGAGFVPTNNSLSNRKGISNSAGLKR